MKHFLFFLMLLGSASAFAMKCDDKFICEGNGVSKNDIKRLSSQLKNHSFNGKPFSLGAVQKFFKKSANLDKPAPSDYTPYWKIHREFEKEYGDSSETRLLFDLAKADYYIKRYEKEHNLIFADTDQVSTDYRFLGNARIEAGTKDYSKICIMDAISGEADTKCKHNPGNNGLGGTLLFLASMGSLDESDNNKRENTSCVTEKPIHALVRTIENGEEIVYASDFTSKGQAVEFDENVWFRKGLKVASQKECEKITNQIQEEVIIHACSRHRPWDGIERKVEFDRSPAVIEQYTRSMGK
ncbi:MAG TPA: hypothetical protein VNJ08_17005 [Bacteriovoracaceae bacterium]|nr:hypothetical protein [Bacteriovoracaceae bacterium]